MTTLCLKIRGLCGLVPNEPIPEESEPDRVVSRIRVLVLDTTILGKNLNLCPHKPRIILGPPGNQQAPMDLAGHKIEIEGLDDSEPIELVDPDFWEVARMNQVTKLESAVDDGFLLDPPGAGIVANLVLTSGVATGIERVENVQNFQNDPQRPYAKRFAQAVQLTVPFAGPGKLRLTPFDPQSPNLGAEIDLTPDENDEVHITVSNLCDLPKDAPGREEEGIDFAAFYSLLRDYDGPLFVPRDLSQPHFRGEVRGEAVKVGAGCVPGTFHNHPDA